MYHFKEVGKITKTPIYYKQMLFGNPYLSTKIEL